MKSFKKYQPEAQQVAVRYGSHALSCHVISLAQDIRVRRAKARYFWALSAFVVLCIVSIFSLQLIPLARHLQAFGAEIKENTEAKGQEAFAALFAALKQMQEFNLFEAQISFQKAAEDFKATSRSLVFLFHPLDDLIRFVPFYGEKFQTARSLATIGELLSNIGSEVSAGLKSMTVLPPSTQAMKEFSHNLEAISPLWDKMQGEIMRVNEQVLPITYREAFVKARNIVLKLAKANAQAAQLLRVLAELGGNERPKRYLLIFQNNAEMRPTGGFMGSLALIDVKGGKVENLEVPKGGIYDIAGQMPERVLAPEPLYLVNPHWNIQDANWFPDFPASAEKILWFWDKSGGPTVDGIITLTPTVIEEFLKIIGPIVPIGPIGPILTPENFIDITQEETSRQPYETTKPKEFLASLTPLLLEKIFSLPASKLPLLVVSLVQSLQEKRILLYFNDAEFQRFFESLNWTGSLQNFPGDYLGIYRANIRGDKTDRVIKETLRRRLDIQENGAAVVSVALKREHQGIKGEKFTGSRHFSYIRFYVPKGSTLLSASGFSEPPYDFFETPEEGYQVDQDLKRIEGAPSLSLVAGARITSEFNKTSFGFWTIMDPGETKVLEISYKLPFTFTPDKSGIISYQAFFQKQPGTGNIPFESAIKTPSSFETLWSNFPFSSQAPWERDFQIGAVFKVKS